MILFQFLLFLISENQQRNIVFHTFHCYLLDFIKIRTEHFALKQRLCYLRMDISFEVRANAISLIANIDIYIYMKPYLLCSKIIPSFFTIKEVFSTSPSLLQGELHFLPKPLFNSLYDPFGSPSMGQKPQERRGNRPARCYLFENSPSFLTVKEGSTSHLGLLPSGKKRKTALLGARNRYALRLADHQRSAPDFAGWDRWGTACRLRPPE